jgi:methylphosphotriester-DNA--protein-cysteine methyltransferase
MRSGGSRIKPSTEADLGYTSEFAFANAFKRTHGTAPGTFRRRS